MNLSVKLLLPVSMQVQKCAGNLQGRRCRNVHQMPCLASYTPLSPIPFGVSESTKRFPYNAFSGTSPYRGHHCDPAGCPVKRSVPNSEVDLYTALRSWDSRQCPH